MCLQDISPFLEEKYYDKAANKQVIDFEDYPHSSQFVFIYGFISLLSFFIIISLMSALYYQMKPTTQDLGERPDETQVSGNSDSSSEDSSCSKGTVVYETDFSTSCVFESDSSRTLCNNSYLSVLQPEEISNSAELISGSHISRANTFVTDTGSTHSSYESLTNTGRDNSKTTTTESDLREDLSSVLMSRKLYKCEVFETSLPDVGHYSVSSRKTHVSPSSASDVDVSPSSASDVDLSPKPLSDGSGVSCTKL